MSNKQLENYDLGIRSQIADGLEAISVLEKVAQEEAAFVRERDFKEKLLPVLASDKTNTSVMTWIELAGNVMRPIVVVDTNNKPLFKLPPFLDSLSPIEPSKRLPSVSAVLAVSQLKTSMMPKLGEKHIVDNLIPRVPKNSAKPTNLAILNEVLVKYGYPTMGTVKGVKVEEGTVKVSGSEPAVVGFDDF